MSTGKLTVAEWDIICAVEQYWNEHHTFPASDTIAQITDRSVEQVISTLESERCQKRFAALGINPNAAPQKGKLAAKDTRLSYEQLAAAGVLLNPFDTRSRSQKLKSLGIPPATFQGWMKSKSFSKYLSDRSEEMFGDAMPLMQDALIRTGMKGSVPAIKLYMEMQGRYNSQTMQSTQDFKILVFRLIEILQKHIKDPQVLQILSDEIKTLVNPTPASVVRGELERDNHTSIIS